MNVETAQIVSIISKRDSKFGGLISILEDIQALYGYLPEETLRIVSQETGYSMVDIYGVATFYKSFSLKPRGKHLVSACLGTACHVRGGPAIVAELRKQLAIEPGETTADNEFTLETVNCLGACAQGPIIVIDGHYFSHVQREQVAKILDHAREGLDKIEIDGAEHIFPVNVACTRCNHSFMDTDYLIDGYPSIRVTISFGRKHGWLRLSSLYGSFNIDSQYPIPLQTIVNFFCPHCHAEFLGASRCPACSAPMVPMIVRGGGMIQICSRRGCREHMLDVSGVNL